MLFDMKCVRLCSNKALPVNVKNYNKYLPTKKYNNVMRV